MGEPVSAVTGAVDTSPVQPTRRAARTLPRFLVKRLAITIGLLIGITVLLFLLVQAVPGGPVQTNLSQSAQQNPTVVAAYKAKWGLDKPLPVQYLTYIENLVHGDLGTSMRTGNPVLSDLEQAIPATVEIAVPAIALSLILSIGLGMWSAVRKDRVADHTIRGGALLGLSTPQFWLAIVALYIFFYVLGVAPNGGQLSTQYLPPPHVTGMYAVDAVLAGQWATFWDAVWHLILPVLVLSTLTTAILIRFVRSAMLEVLGEDYIRTAYAKGLPRRVILRRHLLRAGLVQVVTVSGLAFASLLAGAVLVEDIFSWPGVGEYAYQSALNLDTPAVVGVGLFVGLVYTVINLLVDVLYGIIDPRIRVS